MYKIFKRKYFYFSLGILLPISIFILFVVGYKNLKWLDSLVYKYSAGHVKLVDKINISSDVYNTFFQPIIRDDDISKKVNQKIEENCANEKADKKQYATCLKKILYDNETSIEALTRNITRLSKVISDEFIRDGIYKNEKLNKYSVLYVYLDDMTENFYEYSEKLCLVHHVEDFSDDQDVDIENTKCQILLSEIYVTDLYRNRSYWITDKLYSIDPNLAKSEEFKKAVEDENALWEAINSGE